LEKKFGKRDLSQEPRWRYGAAFAIVAGAVAVLTIGQPTTADRWAQIEPVESARLANREVQIHPGELLEKLSDPTLQVIMLDIRSEADYNLFHIRDARHVRPEMLPDMIPALLEEPANTLFVVMGNDETAAAEAWKLLRAESVPTAYILEGGVNKWLAVFADEEFKETAAKENTADDALSYTFSSALGSRYEWAAPNPAHYTLTYIPKEQLEIKRWPGGGGCG
jgi:rhodanese-related sulfurtransferase